jgi:hypothetical protein
MTIFKQRRLVNAGALTDIAIAAASAYAFAVGPGRSSTATAKIYTPAALDRSRTPGDALPPAAQRVLSQLGMDPSASRQVASGTFLVPSEHGNTCLVSVFGVELPYVCQPTAAFFASRQAIWVIHSNGNADGPTEEEISGVLAPGVRHVKISYGAFSRSIEVGPDGGFNVDFATGGALPSLDGNNGPSVVATP